MSRARKNRPQANQDQGAKEPQVQVQYPILLEDVEDGRSKKKFLFGLIVDRSISVTRRYDMGDGKIKTEYEHWRRRYIFGKFKYLKEYSFDVYTYDKPTKTVIDSVQRQVAE